ncbi:MAG: hypothetical protein M3464_02575 [Chloroflexota bacterium]|nr:hypothetical protein [Chloroflexota bacterium]
MPTIAQFDAAMLQIGRSVPAVKRLGGGTILLSRPDQPWRIVGRTAVVYQLSQPSGGTLALRCPLGEPGPLDPTLGDRYRGLATDPAVAPLRRSGGPLVGGLVYFAEGLSLPASEFRSVGHPVMVMEWVKGPTLLAAVDRACDEEDVTGLTAVTEAWAVAMARLARAGFTHGDLVADNVMLRPSGGIALVDYDTCTWRDGVAPRRPAAADALPPGYAHPSGAPPPPAGRDDFPALVIYASLQALSRWPRLRQRFGDPPTTLGGGLLFSGRDFSHPEGSTLIRALRELDDPVIARLLTTLLRAAGGPVAEVPPLHEVVAEVRMVTARSSLDQGRSRSAWQPERLTTRTEAWPTAPRRPELEATEILPRIDGFDRQPPAPDWRSPPAPARSQREALIDPLERQRKLTRLNSLLLAGDEAGAERFWQESGLADDREAGRELGTRIGDIQRRRRLDEARSAVEAGDADAFVRSWNEGGLDQYQPAASLRPLLESARRRTSGAEHLRAALDVNDVAAVLRLWPEVKADPRAAAAAVRVHTLITEHATSAIAGALRRGDDAALIAAVEGAETAGVAIDQTARRSVRAARERAETRRALRAAIAVDDRTALAALALSGRLAELGPIEPGVTLTVKRALAWPHLDRALRADDDNEISATYDADLFADAQALTPQQRTRVELARHRLGWLEQVRHAIKRRDASTLRSALGKPPPGAETRLTQVERARIVRLTTTERT